MTRKFVTLNHHSANDYINADVAWSYVQRFYLDQYTDKEFIHASLSTAPFVAYIWQFGNQETGWDGNIPPLQSGQLEDFKDFLRAGGGHVYYGMFNFDVYPGIEDPMNTTFEKKINAACVRLTERFHPFTGEMEPLARAGKCYGMDAANYYIGDLGQDGRVSGVINWESAVDWWAARICGTERGEYAGPSPFHPDMLEIPGNPLDLPDWLSCYRSDFDETPFYWFCGLQTFLPFKFPANAADAGPISVGFQFTPCIDDTSQKLWSTLTHAEKFAFIMDWINGQTSPLQEVRVGCLSHVQELPSAKVYAVETSCQNG